VKVVEVLMLLELFMEVEAILMRMRMELQAQEVAVIQESLGLNCSLTVLGPDGLRLECLGVADECQGQQVIAVVLMTELKEGKDMIVTRLQ